MEKRAITQSANPVLPARVFTPDALLPPRRAIAAFLARVALGPLEVEYVTLESAQGRVLAQTIVTDDDYPNAARSAMDGFAVVAEGAPGSFRIIGEVPMGGRSQLAITRTSATRIPTGGVLPAGANAVVPIEDARMEGDVVTIETPVEAGANVVERSADMRCGEAIMHARRRIRPSDIGVLATLGIVSIPVYRRPVFAVLSSGDELVEPNMRPAPGQIRDSNRYVIAASLRAMGADARHYPTLRDESEEFASALATAIAECDGVAITGGSSVGERDRLPDAVVRIAKPGIIVHGLRVKPGKPTLFGAHGSKPILGFPGNPTSALMMLEAVAAPIVAALTGAPVAGSTLTARLTAPAHSRPGWTWYIPVELENDGGTPLAHPLPLRSFSVSLTARADGFIIMDESDEEWPAGAPVAVHRFLGG